MHKVNQGRPSLGGELLDHFSQLIQFL